MASFLFSIRRFGGTRAFVHRRVPGADAKPVFAVIARATAARRCVKVIASQHASGAMWRSL